MHDVFLDEPVRLIGGKVYYFAYSKRSGNYEPYSNLRPAVLVDLADGQPPVNVRFSASVPDFAEGTFSTILPRLWLAKAPPEQLKARSHAARAVALPAFASTSVLLPPVVKLDADVSSNFLRLFPGHLNACRSIVESVFAGLPNPTAALSRAEAYAVACVCLESLSTILDNVPLSEWRSASPKSNDEPLSGDLRVQLQRFFWWALGLRHAEVVDADDAVVQKGIEDFDRTLRRCFATAFGVIYPSWKLKLRCLSAVSYTHLTLPTKRIV